MPKPKKAGRPKLPRGEAKGRIVPVRFRREDLKKVEAAAKASNKTISEWIRGTVMAIGTFNAYCPRCDRDVIASTKIGRGELVNALSQDAEISVIHLNLDGTGDHEWNLTTQQKQNLRNHMANGFI